MKRILYIQLLVLLYILFTAKSCENRQQANEAGEHARMISMRDSIRLALEPETLSDASAKAFEAIAIIKFSDFSDYLEIFHDTSNDPAFRQKTREMILHQFISENSELELSTMGNPAGTSIAIKQLLLPVRENQEVFWKISTDSIRLSKPLVQTNDSVYTGKVSFAYITRWSNTIREENPKLFHGTEDIMLIRQNKIFGNDTLKTWNLYLGNKSPN